MNNCPFFSWNVSLCVSEALTYLYFRIRYGGLEVITNSTPLGGYESVIPEDYFLSKFIACLFTCSTHQGKGCRRHLTDFCERAWQDYPEMESTVAQMASLKEIHYHLTSSDWKSINNLGGKSYISESCVKRQDLLLLLLLLGIKNIYQRI